MYEPEKLINLEFKKVFLNTTWITFLHVCCRFIIDTGISRCHVLQTDRAQRNDKISLTQSTPVSLNKNYVKKTTSSNRILKAHYNSIFRRIIPPISRGKT